MKAQVRGQKKVPEDLNVYDDRSDGRPDYENPNPNRDCHGDHRHRVQFDSHDLLLGGKRRNSRSLDHHTAQNGGGRLSSASLSARSSSIRSARSAARVSRRLGIITATGGAVTFLDVGKEDVVVFQFGKNNRPPGPGV
jgi:hypothetical protein